MEKTDNLDDTLRTCWNLLFRGAVQNRHTFHTPVLASTDGQTPRARTVVLRATNVAERKLLIYTDFRTQKVKDISKIPFVSLVFWDKGKSIQLRASGKGTIHHKNDLAKEKWITIPTKNRRDYATTQPPGSEQDIAVYPVIENWNTNIPTESESDLYYENFAVLEIEITAIDYLKLGRSGHRRAEFIWKEGKWEKSWLTP